MASIATNTGMLALVLSLASLFVGWRRHLRREPVFLIDAVVTLVLAGALFLVVQGGGQDWEVAAVLALSGAAVLCATHLVRRSFSDAWGRLAPRRQSRVASGVHRKLSAQLERAEEPRAVVLDSRAIERHALEIYAAVRAELEKSSRGQYFVVEPVSKRAVVLPDQASAYDWALEVLKNSGQRSFQICIGDNVRSTPVAAD